MTKIYQSLKNYFENRKALRWESPATEALFHKLSESDEGRLVLESGVLTPDEMASLPLLERTRFLNTNVRMIHSFGEAVFIQSISKLREVMLKRMKKLGLASN